MAVERTFYCDGPADPARPRDDGEEGCGGHATTAAADPNYLPHGMLRVVETLPGEQHEFHFCDWDCLLRFAAGVHPTEIIKGLFETDEEAA